MIGTKLAHYEITSHLGSGGMGEVYQATDSKLGRSVAIKILPEAFSHDSERVARFEREARVLASLNHPQIAAIYGLEESGGRKFLVMELVGGETLAQRINQGPIPVEESLQIAKQVCEALEAAHEKGVIHRDLKPANVKITPNGKVKVLDFGLAKAMEANAVNATLSNSPTLSIAATNPGMILGTAAYMSPEQAKGGPVDKRTDIFAFGCVLYEMLTGSAAFDGEGVADILSRVLQREPDWTLLPAKVPPRIRELLRLCLEKNAKNRRSDATDVRLDIEQALAEPQERLVSETPVVSQLPLWRRATPALATLILGAIVASVAVWSLRPPSRSAVVTRFDFALGEGQQFTGTGNNLVAISPDGTKIVYVANSRLYLRRMGELEAKVIPGTEHLGDVTNPVFSPEGDSIAFFSNGMLKRIAASGGTAMSLCPATDPYGMNWSEEGILFGQNSGNVRQSSGIRLVSENGGEPHLLVTVKGDEVATAPQMLPGGKAILFSLTTGTDPDRWDKAKVAVQTIGSTDRKILIEGGSDGHYVPTGHIVYAFSGTLRAVPFDLKRMEVTGVRVPVVEGVRRTAGTTSIGTAQFSFSSNGSLAYIPGPVLASPTRDLVLIDRAGNAVSLKLQPGAYYFPRVAPNGKYVAFQTDNGTDSFISIYDLSGGTYPRRLTFSGNNRSPVWSPDSMWVAFQSDREGDLAIFEQRFDGSGTAQRLTKPDADTSHFPDSWSPDGNTLLFEVRKVGSPAFLWAMSRDKKVTQFGNIQNANPIDAVFSPKGRWVAYNSGQTGKNEVFVQPFPATRAQYQIPKGADNHAPIWSPDETELFYVAGPGQFAAVRITVQPSFDIGNAVAVFNGSSRGTNPPSISRNFDIMPDGKHILAVVAASQDQTGATFGPQIQVILNWFDDLKRRIEVNH